ncbi:AraC family ligand binding domain-containing protein, partial [Leptospira sp. SA-E8]|uniref:AraC-like ligand-binding domain-containing protein n=1 Tax=Leptospira sp. SA-E8 TaxID=3422259 RepID=UPI003EBE0976
GAMQTRTSNGVMPGDLSTEAFMDGVARHFLRLEIDPLNDVALRLGVAAKPAGDASLVVCEFSPIPSRVRGAWALDDAYVVQIVQQGGGLFSYRGQQVEARTGDVLLYRVGDDAEFRLSCHGRVLSARLLPHLLGRLAPGAADAPARMVDSPALRLLTHYMTLLSREDMQDAALAH